jgi:1-acyl-sn-glycerol-3-phosphate acyltransferase
LSGSGQTPEVGEFTGDWDSSLIRRLMWVGGPVFKVYFRSEVRDIDRIPPGGVLIVSNHSGGPFMVDVPTLWMAFFATFGYDRPIFTLGHDLLFTGPLAGVMKRLGVVRASRENAAAALRSGAVVVAFPGGDIDAMRPTSQEAVIDFSGRTGYVTTAIEAAVPIVPVVSIGGQETQLFLTRGTWLAKRLGFIKRLTRIEQFPVSFGFPLGLSFGDYNFPLPSKLVTQVLEPIDVTATFGKNPDIAEVDTYVRKVMQAAMDELAAQRRFPVLG